MHWPASVDEPSFRSGESWIKFRGTRGKRMGREWNGIESENDGGDRIIPNYTRSTSSTISFISIERVPFKMRDSPRYRSLTAVISNGSSNYLDGPRRIFHATLDDLSTKNYP